MGRGSFNEPWGNPKEIRNPKPRWWEARPFHEPWVGNMRAGRAKPWQAGLATGEPKLGLPTAGLATCATPAETERFMGREQVWRTRELSMNRGLETCEPAKPGHGKPVWQPASRSSACRQQVWQPTPSETERFRGSMRELSGKFPSASLHHFNQPKNGNWNSHKERKEHMERVLVLNWEPLPSAIQGFYNCFFKDQRFSGLR